MYTDVESYLQLFLNFIRDTRGPALKEKFMSLGNNITDEQVEEMLKAPYVDYQRYEASWKWPKNGESMTSLQSLEFLHRAVRDVLERNVKGDVIETGVWKGGSIIAMKAAFDAYGSKDRKFWVCDSFEGCPPPEVYSVSVGEGGINDKEDNHWQIKHLQISEEDVRENFRKYGLLDDRVMFVRGWFHETIPNIANQIEKISILRLDGDLYISTMPVLENLYDKVEKGGYVILDDVGLKNHDRAVHEFRTKHNITTPLIRARGNDGTVDEHPELSVHYWIKE